MSTCMLRNWSVKFAGRGKFGTHRSMDMHMDKRSLQHKDRGQSDNTVLEKKYNILGLILDCWLDVEQRYISQKHLTC